VTDTAATEVAEPAPPAPEAEPDDTRSARERVIDHLTDSEGPQSVEQILAGTGLNRNACEQAIFRAKKAEQIIWVAPGVYALAPPKPLPSSRNGHSNEEWVARIEAWQVNPASWNVEEDGPPPNDPNHRIPLDVVGRFKDRQAREAKEREKREAAAAKQAAADRQLRDQLLAACNYNYAHGLLTEDLAPIKLALETVPLDRVLSVIRWKVDRRCYPPNPTLTSWRDPKVLKAIAEYFCEAIVVPSMVDAWAAAGMGPGPTARESSPPAGHTPDDIDELRSRHDQENAPPGPHVMPQPLVDEDAGAAPSAAQDVPANAVDASEAPAAVSRLGAPPGDQNCLAPRDLLWSFGL
jgi:hypothetical protein